VIEMSRDKATIDELSNALLALAAEARLEDQPPRMIPLPNEEWSVFIAGGS
jgi:hypothetical protein